MSYRKIEVDGIKFRYSVGRTHVKIVRDDSFLKRAFKPSTIVVSIVDITGVSEEERNKELSKPEKCSHYGCEVCTPSQKIAVTPQKVVDYIKRLKEIGS